MCCRTSKVLYGLSCLFWIGHAKGKSSWIARESSNNRSEEDSFHQSNRFVGLYRIRPSEENSKREIEWTACLSSEPSAQLFFCVFFFVIAFACVLLALSPHYLYTLLFDCVVSVKWKNYGRTIALQPNSIILPLWWRTMGVLLIMIVIQSFLLEIHLPVCLFLICKE